MASDRSFIPWHGARRVADSLKDCPWAWPKPLLWEEEPDDEEKEEGGIEWKSSCALDKNTFTMTIPRPTEGYENFAWLGDCCDQQNDSKVSIDMPTFRIRDQVEESDKLRKYVVANIGEWPITNEVQFLP
eukprot:753875-Hanusia_phi.AAC.3